MKRRWFALGLWLHVLWTSAFAAFPFTYQGRLYDAGSPADGVYDMNFTLMSTADPNDAGGILSLPLRFHEVPVADGYFTLLLDFEPKAPVTFDQMFDGASRWLLISVRPGELEDPNEYTRLLPMTPIDATPYAHLAKRLQTPALLTDETTEPVVTIENAGTGAELRFENDSLVQYADDAAVDVTNDYDMMIGRSETRSVGTDSSVEVTRHRTETVGGNQVTHIGVDESKTVFANSTMTVGGSLTVVTGNGVQMEAGSGIRLQDSVFVSNDPNERLKVDGAVVLQLLGDTPPVTTGYGKLFASSSDGRLYFMDSSGIIYDLTVAQDERVSFSVKRDVSYIWTSSSTFETVNFSANTTVLDNTGGGFSVKTGLFTAPADGVYSFHGTVFFTGLSKGDNVGVAINAGGFRYRGDAKDAGGTAESIRADVTVYLTQGQTVKLEAYVSSAASPSVFGTPGGTDAFTYFNGARVD